MINPNATDVVFKVAGLLGDTYPGKVSMARNEYADKDLEGYTITIADKGNFKLACKKDKILAAGSILKTALAIPTEDVDYTAKAIVANISNDAVAKTALISSQVEIFVKEIGKAYLQHLPDGSTILDITNPKPFFEFATSSGEDWATGEFEDLMQERKPTYNDPGKSPEMFVHKKLTSAKLNEPVSAVWIVSYSNGYDLPITLTGGSTDEDSNVIIDTVSINNTDYSPEDLETNPSAVTAEKEVQANSIEMGGAGTLASVINTITKKEGRMNIRARIANVSRDEIEASYYEYLMDKAAPGYNAKVAAVVYRELRAGKNPMEMSQRAVQEYKQEMTFDSWAKVLEQSATTKPPSTTKSTLTEYNTETADKAYGKADLKVEGNDIVIPGNAIKDIRVARSAAGAFMASQEVIVAQSVYDTLRKRAIEVDEEEAFDKIIPPIKPLDNKDKKKKKNKDKDKDDDKENKKKDKEDKKEDTKSDEKEALRILEESNMGDQDVAANQTDKKAYEAETAQRNNLINTIKQHMSIKAAQNGTMDNMNYDAIDAELNSLATDELITRLVTETTATKTAMSRTASTLSPPNMIDSETKVAVNPNALSELGLGEINDPNRQPSWK